MTALERARDWFIAPREGTGDQPAWCADPSTDHGRVIASLRLPEAEKHTSHTAPTAAPREPTTTALQPAAESKPRLNGWRPPSARADEEPAVPPAGPGGARDDASTGARRARRDGQGVPPPSSVPEAPDGSRRAHVDAPADTPDGSRRAPVDAPAVPPDGSPRAPVDAPVDSPDGSRRAPVDAPAGRPDGTRRADVDAPAAMPDGSRHAEADAPDYARRVRPDVPDESPTGPGRSRGDAANADRHRADRPTPRADSPAAGADRHGADRPTPRTDSPAHGDHSTLATAAREVTSAAVLGRPGEVEPVAAALALALRRDTRAATATVAVVGAALPELTEGGGAARKLGARLAAHGFEARVRGRLAWVRLDPGDGQLATAARRVTLIGAPAVLAVTAPRNADTDRALLDCDLLVIVAADPEGPLASLAANGLADVPVITVSPLGRGPARALARAGIRSTAAIRRLLSTELEEQS